MSKSKKRLNVLNSSKVFNLNLKLKSELDFIRVNESNYKEIWKSIKSSHDNDIEDILSKRDNHHYVLFDTGSYFIDSSFVQDLFYKGGFVSYYTQNKIPDNVRLLLASNRHTSEAIYLFKPQYSVDEIRNIDFVAVGSKVKIDLPVKIKDNTPFIIMNSLADLAFKVDEIQLVFSKYDANGNKVTSYDKYNTITSIRDALSGWKMEILLLADNQDELDTLQNLKDKDSAKRKGLTVW